MVRTSAGSVASAVALFMFAAGAVSCGSSAEDASSPPAVTQPAVPPVSEATPSPIEEDGEPAASAGPYVATTFDDPGHLDLGAEVFASSCAGCHGAEAQGSSRGPALIGVAKMLPDRERVTAIVTWGTGDMTGKGEVLGGPEPLTAEEIDAVVSYIRLTFVE